MHNCLEDTNSVVYCAHCLSLAVRVLDLEDSQQDYCDQCGNTNIEMTDFSTWEKMYEAKYGEKYLTINK